MHHNIGLKSDIVVGLAATLAQKLARQGINLRWLFGSKLCACWSTLLLGGLWFVGVDIVCMWCKTQDALF